MYFHFAVRTAISGQLPRVGVGASYRKLFRQFSPLPSRSGTRLLPCMASGTPTPAMSRIVAVRSMFRTRCLSTRALVAGPATIIGTLMDSS